MITKTNHILFNRAVELALNGEHRVRVGALAAIKSKPVAGAWNTIRNKTTYGVDFTAHTFHAEDNCINLIPYEDRKKVTLYIARVDKNGQLMPSFPCRFCLERIFSANLKEFVFWDGEDLVKL